MAVIDANGTELYVGDVVECVDDKATEVIRVGQQYVITATYADSDLIAVDKMETLLFASRFRLVRQPQPTQPAFVDWPTEPGVWWGSGEDRPGVWTQDEIDSLAKWSSGTETFAKIEKPAFPPPIDPVDKVLAELDAAQTIEERKLVIRSIMSA